MKPLKTALLFFIVVICGVAFVGLNISSDYPVHDACANIRMFTSQHKRSPTSDEIEGVIPKAKLFSVREYTKKGNDFLFYFCQTRLGPCQVCTNKDGPYSDEI